MLMAICEGTTTFDGRAPCHLVPGSLAGVQVSATMAAEKGATQYRGCHLLGNSAGV